MPLPVLVDFTPGISTKRRLLVNAWTRYAKVQTAQGYQLQLNTREKPRLLDNFQLYVTVQTC